MKTRQKMHPSSHLHLLLFQRRIHKANRQIDDPAVFLF
jgi:hypothetical protein